MNDDSQDTSPLAPPADPSTTVAPDAGTSTPSAVGGEPPVTPAAATNAVEPETAPERSEIDAGDASKKIDATLTGGGTLPMVGAEGSDAPHAPAAGAGKKPAEKIDAIICIPGIGSSDGTRFDDVAKRIVTALERCATSGKAVFSVAVRDAKMRDGKSYSSVAICRQDTPTGNSRDVLHLYEYDYRPVLDNGLEKSTPVVQASAIAWTLTLSAPRLWSALKRESKDWVQKLQTLYGAVFFGVMAFYLVLLLVGTVAAVKEKLPDPRSTTTQQTAGAPARPVAQPPVVGPLPANAPPLALRPAPQPGRLEVAWLAVKGAAQSVGDFLARWILELAGLVIVIPLAGSFFNLNVREALSRSAPLLTTATAYLAGGKRRPELIGGLGDVLNFMDEQADGQEYEQVHVIAYSFGSVVAIDSLFPKESAVSRQFERIQTLVTIGCPYDFVRTYWPTYFQDRYALAEAARPRWINVFSPIDVLGSNFIDEPPAKERRQFIDATPNKRHEMRKGWDKQFERGVDLMDGTMARPSLDDNVPFGPGQGGTAPVVEWFKFIGFRAHGMYWSRESASAVSCFETVVKRLYADRDPARALT